MGAQWDLQPIERGVENDWIKTKDKHQKKRINAEKYVQIHKRRSSCETANENIEHTFIIDMQMIQKQKHKNLKRFLDQKTRFWKASQSICTGMGVETGLLQ